MKSFKEFIDTVLCAAFTECNNVDILNAPEQYCSKLGGCESNEEIDMVFSYKRVYCLWGGWRLFRIVIPDMYIAPEQFEVMQVSASTVDYNYKTNPDAEIELCTALYINDFGTPESTVQFETMLTFCTEAALICIVLSEMLQRPEFMKYRVCSIQFNTHLIKKIYDDI